MITLQQLKRRRINPETRKMMEHTCELAHWNIMAIRNRMADQDDIRYQVFDLTHNGNDPKDNKELLDDARMYIEKGVYTDEEWEQYFIPAINEMIAYNNNFVRWHPGYLLRNKETGKLAILEYDYSTAFRGRNYTSLALCELDDKDKIRFSWAWANYNNYELVDSEHTAENIAKLKAYHAGDHPPYCMCSKMSQLLYGMESTPPPIRY